MSINRRAFLGWAGVGAAASSLGMAFANRLTKPPRIASADSPISDLEEQPFRGSLNSYKFPKDFFWGVATSAFQIEGAVNEGGRKPSVWDTFSAIPGRIKDGSSPAVACDHYHRYKDDIKLMAQLGVKHYRFSIAWPRIIPDGRGKVNEEGVDFYKRLLDELNKYGITPHATLFHWDSPQALEDKYGSWRSREIASDFADYATAIVTRLGDSLRDSFA